VTLDQIRIAHNAALSRGDAKAAGALRAQLAAALDLKVSAAYDNKTVLIGGTHNRGAQRSITLYFVAGKFAADTRFAVQSKVLSRAPLSTLPIDPSELDIALPPRWPTTLWQPGHIYSIKVVYRRRPGHERLRGNWASATKRTDAAGPVDLLRL
jgi:hypothetical protein